MAEGVGWNYKWPNLYDIFMNDPLGDIHKRCHTNRFDVVSLLVISGHKV